MTGHDNNNLIIDGAISAGALTLPWWAQALGEWAALAVTLATLILLVYRIALAMREWYRG